MDKIKVKIPKRIPEKDWAIPIPDDLGSERQDMEDLEAYKIRLERLGFYCAYQTKSLSCSDMKRGSLNELPSEYSLWHNPEGVLLVVKSYNDGGYFSSSQNKHLPIRETLGTVSVYLCVDVGCGPEIQHIAAVRFSGSGSSCYRPDGSLLRFGNDYFHKNTGGGVSDMLEMAQALGRLVPISKWGIVGERLPHFPSELLSPIKPGEALSEYNQAKMDGDSGKERQLYHKVLIEFLEKLPGSLGAELIEISHIKNDRHFDKIYDGVEEAINYCSETMFLSGKRWMSEQESVLLICWAAAAAGKIMDQAHWRIDEVGPAGINIASFLAMADTRTGAREKLLEVVKNSDTELLRRWCTEPDDAGFTLPLLILRDLVRNNGNYTVKPEYDDSITLETLEVLASRLGPHNLVLNTDKRSALGLLVEFEPNGSATARLLEVGQRRFSKALAVLDSAGVKWNQDLNWRTYPNIMTDKTDPQFCSIRGIVSGQDLLKVMEDRTTSELDGVVKKLDLLAQSPPQLAATRKPKP